MTAVHCFCHRLCNSRQTKRPILFKPTYGTNPLTVSQIITVKLTYLIYIQFLFIINKFSYSPSMSLTPPLSLLTTCPNVVPVHSVSWVKG